MRVKKAGVPTVKFNLLDRVQRMDSDRIGTVRGVYLGSTEECYDVQFNRRGITRGIPHYELHLACRYCYMSMLGTVLFRYKPPTKKELKDCQEFKLRIFKIVNGRQWSELLSGGWTGSHIRME